MAFCLRWPIFATIDTCFALPDGMFGSATMFAFFFITMLGNGTSHSFVVFGSVWEANFRVFQWLLLFRAVFRSLGLLVFLTLEKLLFRLDPGEGDQYRLLFRLSERPLWLFWETRLSVHDDLATASWILVERLRTNSVKVSRGVSVLILLTTKVCIFKHSISIKEWASSVACSALSASVGFALRTSDRTDVLDKPAVKMVCKISFRTTSTW